MPSARPKLEMSTVAPCSCANRATAKPIEESMVTPATRIRLPSRMPLPPAISVPHPEAAVDRDDRPGDVRRRVAGQPGDGAGHLMGTRVAAQRHLRLDRGLLLV